MKRSRFSEEQIVEISTESMKRTASWLGAGSPRAISFSSGVEAHRIPVGASGFIDRARREPRGLSPYRRPAFRERPLSWNGPISLRGIDRGAAAARPRIGSARCAAQQGFARLPFIAGVKLCEKAHLAAGEECDRHAVAVE